MLPLDPSADIARKAWIPCPRCQDDSDCGTCLAGRNCPDHWRYLLSSTANVLHVQCPGCTHLWSERTAFGTGGA
ncbi:hypothetical protein [Wenjunlia tyrosinilytica]|uniref:Uncharacterized protein n=1 Tax=Wenjunlia tyrosinilytica TaxID=1544741 RepID=A0A918DZH7_9ACTN|nr:hypothetical protein [Wenjunlia tyrosinilytica]GGO89868.1 hypothetical protein GCM10012280_34070 [Wenjunlia tyrosinilytica]